MDSLPLHPHVEVWLSWILCHYTHMLRSGYQGSFAMSLSLNLPENYKQNSLLFNTSFINPYPAIFFLLKLLSYYVYCI